MQKILIGLYVLATSAALIVLKLGTKSGSPVQVINSRPHLNLTPYTVIGIGMYGFSFLLYMYLISKFDLGYIIPITTAFVYVIIFTASYFIFKEAFTFVKIIGISLILVGIFFLNLKG